MDESHHQVREPRVHSRAAFICSTISVVVLCVTGVLVAVLFVGVFWLGVVGQLGYASIFFFWVVLPPLGVVLAIPGMRPPRMRRALIGLLSNTALWAAFPVSLIVATLIGGP